MKLIHILIIAAAEEMLIIADKDGGHVILYPLGGASEEYNILASSTMPVAVTYDPVERQVGKVKVHLRRAKTKAKLFLIYSHLALTSVFA